MIARSAGVVLLLAAAALGSAAEPRAGLKLHGLFGDGLVLQRDLPCPVWGTAAPGETVEVAISGQKKKSAKTGADGRWSVRLDPISAGGPHELTVSGSSTLTVRDILVGEVWLAAGGSNMQMPLKATKIAQTDVDDSIGRLRFFVVPPGAADEPQNEVSGSWKSARSEATGEFSAAAYYFGRELVRQLKVPVGILQASADDSRIDQWSSKRSLGQSRGGRASMISYTLQMRNYEDTTLMYLDSVRKAEEAKKKGEPIPRILPKPPKPDPVSDLYNARIAPLIPYGLKGAIWYQGEIETWNAWLYASMLPGLIKSWRAEWGQGEFPFGYVQLANHGSREYVQPNSIWAQFRDVQMKALETPHTGMVVAVDLGGDEQELPRNKEDVGKRLSLWALARAYGKDLVYSGPLYDSMAIQIDKIRVRFKNVGGGLKVNGSRLKGFKMSGDFRIFVDADAEIDGDTVVVSSKECHWPAAVRYAWAENPDCNLTNKEGLPASPFRSDNW
jgi:sialate O-acetylesterase